MKSKNSALSILDVLIVLINVAAGRGNYLLFGLFHIQNTLNVCILAIVIDVLYILIRFVFFSPFSIKIPPAASIFIILLLYNALNLAVSGGNATLSFFYFILMLLFAIILAGLFSVLRKKDVPLERSVQRFSSGYLWLSFFSIFGVIISFILLSSGLTQYDPVDVDFLKGHDDLGVEHYWSFFSMNSSDAIIRVPFFQDYGMLTGLFHEPHILTLNVFPCLILLLGLSGSIFKKILVVVLALLMLLFSGSTTNILVTGICLSLFLLIHFRKNFFGVVLSIFILYVAITYYYRMDDTLFLVVSGRLEEENLSQQVSRNLLEFAFTPKTLFGSNIFLSAFAYGGAQTSDDVGFIAFFFNIAFLFFYFRNIFKLLRMKDGIAETVAFASLYYILHSAKVGLTMYLQTLPLLLVFLQTIIITYGRNSLARKNLST